MSSPHLIVTGGPLLLPERQFHEAIALGFIVAVGHKFHFKGAGEVMPCPAMELPGVPMPDLISYHHTPRNRAERRAKKAGQK